MQFDLLILLIYTLYYVLYKTINISLNCHHFFQNSYNASIVQLNLGHFPKQGFATDCSNIYNQRKGIMMRYREVTFLLRNSIGTSQLQIEKKRNVSAIDFNYKWAIHKLR